MPPRSLLSLLPLSPINQISLRMAYKLIYHAGIPGRVEVSITPPSEPLVMSA